MMYRDYTVEQVIEMLISEYKRAKTLKYVRDPLAFALYNIWKKIDRNGRDNE